MAVVHVAVGVILDEPRRRVLLSQRAQDAHQGGLWEFPGGKVEAHENVEDALARELQEELDICVGQTSHLLDVRHDYGDKQVWLDVHVVWDFSGDPRGLEGQPLSWAPVSSLAQFAFPAANVPIVEAVLNLPRS